jgi:hypothetical protein
MFPTTHWPVPETNATDGFVVSSRYILVFRPIKSHYYSKSYVMATEKSKKRVWTSVKKGSGPLNIHIYFIVGLKYDGWYDPYWMKNHNMSQPPEIQQSTMKPWKKGRVQKGKSDLLVGCCVEGVRRPWMRSVCCSGDDMRRFLLHSALSLLLFAFLVGNRRAIREPQQYWSYDGHWKSIICAWFIPEATIN